MSGIKPVGAVWEPKDQDVFEMALSDAAIETELSFSASQWDRFCRLAWVRFKKGAVAA